MEVIDSKLNMETNTFVQCFNIFVCSGSLKISC